MSVSAQSSDAAGLPDKMTVVRIDSERVRSPDDIASAPFLVQPLFAGTGDGEQTAIRAILEPDVITHWHSHPLGQLLLVESGSGLAQRRGGPVVVINAGDIVWFAPDEEHWHGARPASAFSYVSIQDMRNGTAVRWLEPVVPNP